MASNKTKGKGAAGQKTQADPTVARDAASKAPAKAQAASKADAKKGKAKDAKSKKNGKPSFISRAATYFKNVRTELKRVVWPSREDLVKYSVAVVAMLVFFGVLIALVDSIILPALYAFSGLR